MALALVTGGCGFIGGHLAEALCADGYHVRILDDLSTGRRENAPTECEVIVGDVADFDIVGTALDGVDVCFHLAAVSSVERTNNDWVGSHRVNLGGMINVLEAARAQGDRAPPVIYASSAAVYGNGAEQPLAETARPSPINAYGADKLGCELHAAVAAVRGVRTTGLRFFNVYGPRQDPNSPYSGVVSRFAASILDGREITIFGDGKQVRDFVFVRDVVQFLLASAKTCRPGARVFNVCTGRATSVNELAEALFDLLGRKEPVAYAPPRTGDIRSSVGEPGLARRSFGFGAATTLADGLRETLLFLRRDSVRALGEEGMPSDRSPAETSRAGPFRPAQA